jgi:hypothetical protein
MVFSVLIGRCCIDELQIPRAAALVMTTLIMNAPLSMTAGVNAIYLRCGVGHRGILGPLWEKARRANCALRSGLRMTGRCWIGGAMILREKPQVSAANNATDT